MVQETIFSFLFPVPIGYTTVISLVIALYCPDSETKLIARDDDSGTGWNAKIAADLSPGTYYIRAEQVHTALRTGKGTPMKKCVA